MADNKITVTWDDLNTRKVEARLKEQDALNRTREYARMDEASLPQAGTAPSQSVLGRLWYNSVFTMALFGLVGGFIAFFCTSLFHFAPNGLDDAKQTMASVNRVADMEQDGQLSSEQANSAREQTLKLARRNNPYFRVMSDATLSEQQRNQQLDQLAARDRSRTFIANVLSYGVCGVMIALFLAIAGPTTDRNLAGVVVNGSVGAALGLLGGII